MHPRFISLSQMICVHLVTATAHIIWLSSDGSRLVMCWGFPVCLYFIATKTRQGYCLLLSASLRTVSKHFIRKTILMLDRALPLLSEQSQVFEAWISQDVGRFAMRFLVHWAIREYKQSNSGIQKQISFISAVKENNIKW